MLKVKINESNIEISRDFILTSKKSTTGLSKYDKKRAIINGSKIGQKVLILIKKYMTNAIKIKSIKSQKYFFKNLLIINYNTSKQNIFVLFYKQGI